MTARNLRKSALDYHSLPVPGKISVDTIKSAVTQNDLSLCYTPGVAEPVREIARDAKAAYQYTAKGNLVGIITNGTAVLGLGNVGGLASKPVMEGKAVLFKRFAGIDAFDIEMDCEDPQEFIETVVRISPTFGAINLEDIQAPGCFLIEEELQKRLSIPVLHDDQHGTAIVVAAGLLNALELQGKSLDKVRIVCAGAGAAGIATMNLLRSLGASSKNVFLVDRGGVIHKDRKNLNKYKQSFAAETESYTLAEIMREADVFIGVAGPDLVTPDMLKSMADKPIVFALSNPNPEIMPELVADIRNDVLIATGRSDYPNQVNNALCFPYLFRGALNVHANCINESMMRAAVQAIKELAHEPVPKEVLDAYDYSSELLFGPDYFLPKILDPRLRQTVSSAVATAAIRSGVAVLDCHTV